MSTVPDDPEPVFLPRERWWLAAGAIAVSAFLLFLGAIADLDVIRPIAPVTAEALRAAAGLRWFAILVIWLGLWSAEARTQRKALHTMMAVALLGLGMALGTGLESVAPSTGPMSDAPR